MPTQDASLRQDLIENAVQQEIARIEETVASAWELDAAFDSALEHDLITWPREYLETSLDSDDKGRIPLNDAALQDLLDAAFDRNEQLVHSFREDLEEKSACRIEELGEADRSSLRDRSSAGSESFKAAQAQVNSALGPSAETRFPLTNDGVYMGKIISETAGYLVQRVSGMAAIAHPKSLFAELPKVGQLVRIAYNHETVAVREMAIRQSARELAL